MPVEPIPFELEAFCKQFTAALEPYNDALEQSTRTLRDATTYGSPIQSVLSDLQDNQHRLKILLDKARQQHTYLVIFGPLKSGKSTLMNAISGSYVSEVSSLPAYPCLVYVHEGESRGFSSTAFNGDSTEYESHKQLHGMLETAHEDLARRIREADEAGQSFNPATDFDNAIRRIDFTMPAPYLRESGTILVDTPGLYTKMKYDYGQLTRDFRDTAACAVFVVKTDNLFFEQVFEEFADLLEVFSRVFLVVNIDSSKQDLGPDGKLEPSLEQRDPRRIVEAFENLTVSAQIRCAIDEGRLRIYMIDLLQTATRSLQGDLDTTGPNDVAEKAVEESENEAGATPEPATAAIASEKQREPSSTSPQLGFDAFLGDLTKYLNSSEYIVEFMADSFRQADSIRAEVKEQLAEPEIVEFREGIEGLKKQAERAERQLAEVKALRENKWDGPLEELTREITQRVTEHAGSVLPDLKSRLHEEVRHWVETDESVSDLISDRLQPKVREACGASRKRAIELTDGACATRNSGLRLSAEIGGRIYGLGLSFNDIYPEFQPVVHKCFNADPELPDPSGLQEALPLQKRFVDWLLFRSGARLRGHILGENNPSKKPIPAAVKAKRIDEAGVQSLCEAVGEYGQKTFADALESELSRILREFRDFFQQHARERLDAKVDILRKDHEELSRQHDLRKNVAETLDELDGTSDSLGEEVRALREKFVPGMPTTGPGDGLSLVESDQTDDSEHSDNEPANGTDASSGSFASETNPRPGG